MSPLTLHRAEVLDALDGGVMLAWYEFYKGLPQIHSMGWVELSPGDFQYVYRTTSPGLDEAQLICPYDPAETNACGGFVNALIVLNNKRAAHGLRRPFDQLPALVLGYEHITDSLLAIWRATVHFPTEALFLRLRQYQAYKTLWLSCGPPPPHVRHELETDLDLGTTPADLQLLNWLATVRWWSRSRSKLHRAATLAAIGAAWQQAEQYAAQPVPYSRVQTFLAAGGADAFTQS